MSDTMIDLAREIDHLRADNARLVGEVEELRLKLPTTAQAMVYMSLLTKFEKSQAELQRHKDALEKARVALVELIAAAPHEGEGSQRAIACTHARDAITTINEVLGEKQ